MATAGTGTWGNGHGDTRPYIKVMGRGSASIVPDQARMVMGIQVEAPTAREASTRCAEAMRRVIDALTAQGVEGRRIQTAILAVTPQQRHTPEGNWQRAGYTATNTVTVTFREVGRVGAIIDAVIEAGGDDVNIQGTHLLASDTTAAQTEARHAALADARAQAQDIASEMGLRLGAPLAIDAVGQNIPFPPVRRMAHSVMAAAPQPVEAGEMEVTAEVEVVFAIEAAPGA